MAAGVVRQSGVVRRGSLPPCEANFQRELNKIMERLAMISFKNRVWERLRMV
jgi:hypothetical protein